MHIKGKMSFVLSYPLFKFSKSGNGNYTDFPTTVLPEKPCLIPYRSENTDKVSARSVSLKP